MDGKDEPPREQAWAGLCAYPCPSRTPSINGEQDKKKDEVNGGAHWGGWRMGLAPLCHFTLPSYRTFNPTVEVDHAPQGDNRRRSSFSLSGMYCHHVA